MEWIRIKMAKQEQRELIGYIPKNYPCRALRGTPVYDRDFWDKVQATLHFEERRKELFEEFCKNHTELLQKAKKLKLRNDVENCVQTSIDWGLYIKDNRLTGGVSFATECHNWKHRDIPFNRWLKSNDFRKNLDFIRVGGIVPDELLNKLEEWKN